MSSLSSIASTGLHAAQQRLQASAHNIANLGTPNAHRLRVEQSEIAPLGGTQASTVMENHAGSALAQDMVEQTSASRAFEANVQTLKTHDSLIGSLLDTLA